MVNGINPGPSPGTGFTPTPFFGLASPMWARLQGKPYVTVSPVGIATGADTVVPNAGADFGPDTPGTKTCGIQEAINSRGSNGGIVYLFHGVFSITSTITYGDSLNVGKPLYLIGTGRDVSVIEQVANTNLVAMVSGTLNTAAPTGPTTVVLSHLTIDMNGANQNYSSSGFSYIFGADFNNVPDGLLFDVRITGVSERATNPGSAGLGWRPFNSIAAQAVSCVFDNNDTHAFLTAPTTTTEAHNLLALSHLSGALLDGIFLDAGKGHRIISCYEDYPSTALSHAITVSGPLDSVEIADCDLVGHGNGGYGINSGAAGAITALNYHDNRIRGFTGARGINLGNVGSTGMCHSNSLAEGLSYSPTTGLIVIDNIGYNPQGFAITTPSVPASGTAQVNTNPFPVRVYITGAGTTTAYTITDPSGNAETFSLSIAAGQEITLDPGASITFTYTTAPTWKWYGV